MLEVWIIAVIVAGGIIFLALLALIIYRCCCRRPKSKNDKRNGQGQNGHVWQAHDRDVELADEEEPHGKLKEDGLCVDTDAGSTFPRRIKAEEQKPESPQKDGLCEDTEKRFTYPRRGRPEQELLIQTDNKNLSASETALKSAVPVGVSVIKSSGGKDIRDERIKSDVQVHHAQHDIFKEKLKDQDSSSDSSSDSDDGEKNQNGSHHLLRSSDKKGRKGKRIRSFVERKRSKSLHNSLEDVPEYSKPIKRSVSTPSIIARERMVEKDKRFDSLDTWRSTIPIPEPDYPNDISSARLKEDDDQDNAPPSYATSDSGVECLDALSGHDDESINHCDSVPESPGLPSQIKDETSFSPFKETTSYTERAETRYQESTQIRHTADHGINGFQDNAVVTPTKDYTALIDANAEKDSPSPFAANQQGIFFQRTPTENIPKGVSSPYSDPKLALRSTAIPASNSVGNSRQSPTERIQTREEQMDFRSVKLKHTSTNYEQNNTFTILGATHGYTAPSSEKKKEHPVSLEQQKPTSTNYEQNKTFTIFGAAHGYAAPSSEKKKEHPVSLEQQKPKNQDMASPSHSGQTIIINKTDGPNYILGGSKKQANDAEKNVTESKISESDKRADFHRVHLRQTPQSLKQHIGFREELDPRVMTETQTRDIDSTSDKTEKEDKTVVGFHDGVKRFQFQGAQVPKPAYGSHYISKKDPNQKPVTILPQEPVTNLRPVSIVAPEPSTMDREHHQTSTTTTSRNITREVKTNQRENVPIIIGKSEKTRPVSMNVKTNQRENVPIIIGQSEKTRPVSMNVKANQKENVPIIIGQSERTRPVSMNVKANQRENVPIIIGKSEKTRPVSVNESEVSEDRRHIRYSTGNFNQNHVSLGFKDAPQKTITVIRGLDEQEKANTTSSNKDSLEKPVAVVPPQSPKAKRESPEERAAFEEERKKNWKREQIEQKLTGVHIKNQQQNENLIQASGLAYRQCMPELFSKIKQIGEEKDDTPVA